MSWELISFVNSSKNRKLILFKLDKPITPTSLAKMVSLHRSVISRSLLGLGKKGLVKCLNPESKKERYYKITNRGLEVRKQIEKMS